MLTPADDSLLLGRLCANVLNVQASVCYIVSTSDHESRRRADAITLKLRARVSAALADDALLSLRQRLESDSLVSQSIALDSITLQAISAIQLLGSGNVTTADEPTIEESTDDDFFGGFLLYAIIGGAVVVLLLIIGFFYCCCQRQAPSNKIPVELAERQGRPLAFARILNVKLTGQLDTTMYHNAAFAPAHEPGAVLPGMRLASIDRPPPVPSTARPSQGAEAVYSEISDYSEIEDPVTSSSPASGQAEIPNPAYTAHRPSAVMVGLEPSPAPPPRHELSKRQFDPLTGKLRLPDVQAARQAWGKEAGSAIVNTPALTNAEFDRLMIIRGSLVLERKHALCQFTDCYEGFIQQTSAAVPVSVYQYNVDPEESDIIERLKHLSNSQQVGALLLGRHPNVLHTIAIQIDAVIQVLVARATAGSLVEYCQEHVLSLDEQMRLSLEVRWLPTLSTASIHLVPCSLPRAATTSTLNKW